MKRMYNPFLLALLFFMSCNAPKSESNETADQDNLKAVESAADPIKLYVFTVGDILVKDISVFNPGVDEGQQMTFTNSAYLIQHPKGTLIWDTGLADALADSPEGNDSPSFLMKMPNRLIDQLSEINVNPADIDYLAVSHLHGDHIGNMHLFTGATIILQEEEYAGLFENPEAPAAPLDTLKSNESIKINGDHDVFGDGSVIIKRAPGHTPGHQVLFVDLPETGPLVLSGDLYHFTKNRELKGVPSFNSDKEQTLASMELIENFIAEKQATLWIQHDVSQNQGIKHAPEYYQ